MARTKQADVITEEPKAEEPKAEEPKEDRCTLVSTIYMVNPYTKPPKKFEPGVPTEDVLIDSWTKCQIEAGLMKRC